MSFASIGTVAISLIIFGASLLVVINTNHIAGVLESNVQLTVFLDERMSDSDVENVGQQIRTISGVAKIDFVSKSQALRQMKKQYSDKQEIFSNLGDNNPLPDAYKVKVTKAQLVSSVATKIGEIYGVDKVRYGQGIVEKMFSITRWVRYAGLVLMTALGLGAIFLVSTTIRLTVFARRREINIMKFLGATDWFIRWPFILEGIFLGIFGGLLAVMALYTGYVSLVKSIKESMAFIPVMSQGNFMMDISLALVGIGMCIGMVGSFVSVRKHLKV